MYKSIPYNYYLRPCYGSKNLLIEFISGVEHEHFFTDVLDAVKDISPEVAAMADLWMNDEVMYTMHSNLGPFTFSKDVWNFAFIMADEHQECIATINSLLMKDRRFEKIEVDFNNYRLT